jgi:transposase
LSEVHFQKQSPAGPLLGEELAWAIELLTDRQLIAYRHRREGHALNWIAQRLGVSRTRVVHLIGAAEKRLGYAPSVTAKQRSAYKSSAQRRQERESAWAAYSEELASQLDPAERRRILRIFETSATDEEVERRLRERLWQLERERRARPIEHLPSNAEHSEDWSSAVGEHEAEFAAEMEADFGINPVTGDVMRPEDLVEDDGKGYDRM